MGKYIVIGGSKGIGSAIVDNLLENHEVINLSRSAPEISHENLTHHNCDVLSDEFPQISGADGLVYCPGSINLKPVNRLKVEDFREDFEINVIGAVKAVQQYLPILKEGKNPAIVLFSTVASDLGMPFHASVAASKSAVEGFMKSIAAELAPTVRVNAIAPTVTDTDLASKLLRNDRMIDNMKERHPLKKYLQPQEVADMATFLLSEKAASLSGQVFKMDCGITSLKI
ncbi:SDR family NAD(P)-dependent oxidoreductase [Winogradskyella litorisediminis]|uniref:SDR family NAD(P)-dependent oxidoreductase n=1 Tax=Winogradskyella litorisediminis TaxID=1156618 RepID=A0ABW3NA29_9FLAO